MDSRPARACQPTPALHSPAADTNASLTRNADRKSIATTGSARRLARSAARALCAPECPITDPSASAPRTSSETRSPSAALNATETLTVPDQSPLAIMEFARIRAMALAELTPTATFAGWRRFAPAHVIWPAIPSSAAASLSPRTYADPIHAEPTPFAHPDSTELKGNAPSALARQATPATRSRLALEANVKLMLNVPTTEPASTTPASIHATAIAAAAHTVKLKPILLSARAQMEPPAMDSSPVVSRKAIRSPDTIDRWTSRRRPTPQSFKMLTTTFLSLRLSFITCGCPQRSWKPIDCHNFVSQQNPILKISNKREIAKNTFCYQFCFIWFYFVSKTVLNDFVSFFWNLQSSFHGNGSESILKWRNKGNNFTNLC